MADIESGTFTAFPYSDEEREKLPAYEGDDMGRVLVKPNNPAIVTAPDWETSWDDLSGRRIAMRRADCGAGCQCATEVKLA